MIQIKIQGATPKTGKSICTTCKSASIIRGQNCEEIVMCRRIFGDTKYRGIVPFRVSECAEFHPINMPWLHEMEEMAWKIEARRRGPAGFSEPAQGEMEVVITRPGASSPNQPKPPSY